MKVLVVGANSTFAKAAIKALSGNHSIITAGRKNCDITVDIKGGVSIPDDIDAVLNFAATFGGDSDEDIKTTYETNVLGTLHVCQAAADAGVKRVILISSIFALMDSSSPQYSIYALTKKQADELAEFYCRSREIALTIIRPSQIYSEDEGFLKLQPFFSQMLDLAQEGKDILIHGTHKPLRNFIYISDLIEVLSRVIERNITGTYSCAFPENVSYPQIAETAQRVFGKGGEVSFLKDKPDVPDNIFPWDGTIYEKVDYTPQVNLEEGIKKIRMYREKTSS